MIEYKDQPSHREPKRRGDEFAYDKREINYQILVALWSKLGPRARELLLELSEGNGVNNIARKYKVKRQRVDAVKHQAREAALRLIREDDVFRSAVMGLDFELDEDFR